MLIHTKVLTNHFKNLFPGYYFYHLDDSKFMLPDRTDFNISYINSFDPSLFHIFDLSDEPWREVLVERLNELLKRFKYKQYLILSQSLKYHENPTIHNVIYFPHIYFDGAIEWKKNIAEQKVDKNQRQYFLSCLNRRIRVPRLYNFLKIISKSYFDKMLLSIYNINDNHAVSQYQDEWMDESLWKEWNKIIPTLSKECLNDLDIGHSAYHDAYINLVTETFVQPNELFLSEKIWKPVACGQLFIIIGPTGSASVLKKMGVDIFEDIIDHSRYDHIQDWKDRIDEIHKLLDELYLLNWEEIYKLTYERRKNNIENFFNGSFVEIYCNNLADRMSNIAKTEFKYDKNYINNIHN